MRLCDIYDADPPSLPCPAAKIYFLVSGTCHYFEVQSTLPQESIAVKTAAKLPIAWNKTTHCFTPLPEHENSSVQDTYTLICSNDTL